LFQLTEGIEALTERVLADENMLEGCEVPRDTPGWPFEAWKLKDTLQREHLRSAVVAALDTNKPLLETLPVEVPALEKLEVVAETLLLFVSSIGDGGIITPTLWEAIETNMPNVASTAVESIEDVKAEVLDLLSAAPDHNIWFVFLTTTLAKLVGELNPIPAEEPDSGGSSSAAAAPPKAMGGVLGRTSLGFKKAVSGGEAARAKRRTRERRYAEMFGPAVVGGWTKVEGKDKRTEERRRGLIEVFIRKDD
jgi:inositol polyphosphate 5-phosphatase INPP5B/F